MDVLACWVKSMFDIGEVLQTFSRVANMLFNYVGQPCVLSLFHSGPT